MFVICSRLSMPEPNRARYRIESQLQGKRMCEIIDARADLVVMCDACPHFKVWKPNELKRTFARLRNTRIEDIAARLKCRACRSKWLRVGLSNETRRPIN
jgi:hypothetical protein